MMTGPVGLPVVEPPCGSTLIATFEALSRAVRCCIRRLALRVPCDWHEAQRDWSATAVRQGPQLS